MLNNFFIRFYFISLQRILKHIHYEQTNFIEYQKLKDY